MGILDCNSWFKKGIDLGCEDVRKKLGVCVSCEDFLQHKRPQCEDCTYFDESHSSICNECQEYSNFKLNLQRDGIIYSGFDIQKPEVQNLIGKKVMFTDDHLQTWQAPQVLNDITESAPFPFRFNPIGFKFIKTVPYLATTKAEIIETFGYAKNTTLDIIDEDPAVLKLVHNTTDDDDCNHCHFRSFKYKEDSKCPKSDKHLLCNLNKYWIK